MQQKRPACRSYRVREEARCGFSVYTGVRLESLTYTDVRLESLTYREKE
jgi:hypothetical protein